MTTLLTVRTDKKIKMQASRVAASLGFTLSSLINGYLRQLIKTKEIHFHESYEPTPYLERLIKQARKDRKTGKNVSPAFDNINDAVAWLNRKR